MIEIQRTRILAAMVEVSAERGAGNVTVAHIVDRAGVSRRTFYELYSDREACFLDTFDDAIARAGRYVSESYDPTTKWVERVRATLQAVLSFLDAEPRVGQLLIVGSLAAGPEALERRRRVLARAIALVDEGRLETKNGTELPPLTAEGIVGGVLSVLHSRLLVPGDGGARLRKARSDREHPGGPSPRSPQRLDAHREGRRDPAGGRSGRHRSSIANSLLSAIGRCPVCYPVANGNGSKAQDIL